MTSSINLNLPVSLSTHVSQLINQISLLSRLVDLSSHSEAHLLRRYILVPRDVPGRLHPVQAPRAGRPVRPRAPLSIGQSRAAVTSRHVIVRQDPHRPFHRRPGLHIFRRRAVRLERIPVEETLRGLRRVVENVPRTAEPRIQGGRVGPRGRDRALNRDGVVGRGVRFGFVSVLVEILRSVDRGHILRSLLFQGFFVFPEQGWKTN